jgi:hypothetical protein
MPFGKYFLRDRIAIGGMTELWRAKVFARCQDAKEVERENQRRS